MSDHRRWLSHSLPLPKQVQGFDVIVCTTTSPFELNVIVGAPLGRPLARPDGPAFPRTAIFSQAACMHSDLAVVAPDFEQIVQPWR